MRKSRHQARQQGLGDEDKNESYLTNVGKKWQMNESLYLLKQLSILETEAWSSDEEGTIMIYQGRHPSGETHDGHQQTLHYSRSTD